MALDRHFQEYFSALDRSGGEDRCFLCRRSAAEVKAFFGFSEDGTAIDAEHLGLEDVVLSRLDIMSYRGLRPICAVCQLNHDALALGGGLEVAELLRAQMSDRRDDLWPDDGSPSTPTEEPRSGPDEEGPRP
ncbi:MAG: hypothetical protein QF903_07425 [Planctomycetota bacterium]|nr:hypothetical protein [Planctomycetota bacterium]